MGIATKEWENKHKSNTNKTNSQCPNLLRSLEASNHAPCPNWTLLYSLGYLMLQLFSVWPSNHSSLASCQLRFRKMIKRLFSLRPSMLSTFYFLACIFSILLMLPGGHALQLAERKAVRQGSRKHSIYERFDAYSKELRVQEKIRLNTKIFKNCVLVNSSSLDVEPSWHLS
jgi:hypothetical protein